MEYVIGFILGFAGGWLFRGGWGYELLRDILGLRGRGE